MSDTRKLDAITIEKPSHFICSQRCEFGRTTMIPGYYISTVGEFRRNPTDKEFSTVGYRRLYETYVFRWSGARCADPECHCGGVPEPESWAEIDSLPANTRAEAIANHEALVTKWSGVPQADIDAAKP